MVKEKRGGRRTGFPRRALSALAALILLLSAAAPLSAASAESLLGGLFQSVFNELGGESGNVRIETEPQEADPDPDDPDWDADDWDAEDRDEDDPAWEDPDADTDETSAAGREQAGGGADESAGAGRTGAGTLNRNAGARTERVIDDAGLFSDAEEAALEAKIASIRQRWQIDAVIVTSSDVPSNPSSDSETRTMAWADDFYDQNGFGEGEDRAGFLYLIDMHNRVSYISTGGVMIDYISDRRKEELLSDADPALGRGAYAQAAMAVLNAAERMMKAGIEEGHFRYDEATGKRLTGLYNRLTQGEIIVAGLAGIAAALMLYLTVHAIYGLTRETYKFNKMTQSGVELTKDEKTFLRQEVTRTRITQSSGSRGGGGGGGHGSGVHFSSGGSAHGGGGHHF